jgi:hypothetical protein
MVVVSLQAGQFARLVAPQHLQAAIVPVLPLLFALSVSGGTNRAAHGYSAQHKEDTMGFGRGALLWMLGVPLPIILILALFMHH